MTEQQKEVTLLLIEDDDVDTMSIMRAFDTLCLGDTIY